MILALAQCLLEEFAPQTITGEQSGAQNDSIQTTLDFPEEQ